MNGVFENAMIYNIAKTRKNFCESFRSAANTRKPFVRRRYFADIDDLSRQICKKKLFQSHFLQRTQRLLCRMEHDFEKSKVPLLGTKGTPKAC